MNDPAYPLAIGVLAMTVAALASLLVVSIARTHYTFGQWPFHVLHLWISRLIWRVHSNGLLPVLPGRGAIIIANHRSSCDPLIIEAAAPRIVHWMIAREYYDWPPFHWMLKIVETIPVNRGGVDTASTKQAMRMAQQGALIGMFPEGRINTTGQTLLPGRPGVALIALRAKVPVIPCYIHGAPYDGTSVGPFLMPARVRLTIGKPIDITPYLGREEEEGILLELTRRFLKEIATLGGDRHFQPQVAGRRWKPDADQSADDGPPARRNGNRADNAPRVAPLAPHESGTAAAPSQTFG